MLCDGIHMGTNTNKTLKKYGHKKKLIYGYKFKMKRKLVQIKKYLQLKNRYKLKIKIYDNKFNHKYKYTNCNIFNTKEIYLKNKIILLFK